MTEGTDADGTRDAPGSDGESSVTAPGSAPGEEPTGEMTLAFGLEAFRSLADPATAFRDARDWAAHVGIVADDGAAVAAAVRRHGIRQDYDLDEIDAQSALSRLKWEADTDRYVLVGSDPATRELADYVGWEYLPVEDAAAKADWQLVEDLGVLGRLRRRLAGWMG